MFGIGAVTWAFSGMLSMEPFPLVARRTSAEGPSLPQLRGEMRFADFAGHDPRDVLAQLPAGRVSRSSSRRSPARRCTWPRWGMARRASCRCRDRRSASSIAIASSRWCAARAASFRRRRQRARPVRPLLPRSPARAAAAGDPGALLRRRSRRASTSIRRPRASSAAISPATGWSGGCITASTRSISRGSTTTVRCGISSSSPS